MTIEQQTYGTGWLTCSRCKLTAPDMLGTPPRCTLKRRCDAVLARTALGSSPMRPSEVQAIRYELDDAELEQLAAAVEAFRARHAP